MIIKNILGASSTFFLRGIDVNNPGYGIYHTIPAYELIHSLDKLFKPTNRGKE